MPSKERELCLELLCQAVDNPEAQFRDNQWEIIESLVSNRQRLLVVQRTGWGKSLIYFLATRLLRNQNQGLTLLISPLLALMRNQIEAADRLQLKAATINSANPEEWPAIQQRLLANQVDILLVSPERLANDQFREEVLLRIARKIGLFVVDEAHCISDWGHDFRPDYKRITRILQALPATIPLLATTATANDRVVADVAGQLGPTLRIVRGPLARESLRLQATVLPTQAERMAWIADHLSELPGSGIIYTLTVRDAKRVADWLRGEGYDVAAYYGELATEQRERLEARLLANQIKAIVATSALGMGFDKPDIGFVIHFQRPSSVVHYYQQVGRAGRAVKQSYGILLAGAEDDEIADYFIRTAFPPLAYAEKILQALREAPTGLTITSLEQAVNLHRGQIEKTLKLLTVETPAPVIKKDHTYYATPVNYTLDLMKIKTITEIRRHEQQRMRDYLTTPDCLMAFLRSELDDPKVEPCGVCANCLGGTLLPITYSLLTVHRASEYLKRNYLPLEPRKMWIGDALSGYGWKGRIKPELKNQEGRILSLWGDAGWGNLIRDGKQVHNRFADELVTACAAMVKNHWQPDPYPHWVTCVPSLARVNLVADFARRLAAALGLPFIPCISKMRRTEPQKLMHNSYQQAKNLDGAFAVNRSLVKALPVLLVDDMVDSGWTFTVVGVLLRTNGSGPVYPLALAQTTTL